MAGDPPLIRRLSELGYHQVKHLYSTGGFPTGSNLAITHWLAEQEAEAERLSSIASEQEASAAERAASAAELSVETAALQTKMAKQANRIAVIAVVIATISIIITVVGILVTHFDLLRH
jgi:hypothetical protein